VVFYAAAVIPSTSTSATLLRLHSGLSSLDSRVFNPYFRSFLSLVARAKYLYSYIRNEIIAVKELARFTMTNAKSVFFVKNYQCCPNNGLEYAICITFYISLHILYILLFFITIFFFFQFSLFFRVVKFCS